MEDKRQEDVDVLYILQSIKKGISHVLKFIVGFFNYSLKNAKILGISILIFTSATIAIYSISKPYYTAWLTVSHSRLENDYCRVLINSLNTSIVPAEDNTKLAKILSMSKTYAKDVRLINYQHLNSKIADRYADSTRVMLPFRIEVLVYNNNILDTLQKSLLNYLESNDYVSKRRKLENEALDKTEARLDKEISDLDSLKHLVEKGVVPQSTGNGITLNQPINPVVVYETILRLHEQKTRISSTRQLNNSFEIVVGFSESNKRGGLGVISYAAIGIILGYFLGLYLSIRKTKRMETGA